MSKRMTKVLSMILTLVMFLSVSTPAFAWGNIGIGDGWDRDIGEDEVRDFDVDVEEGEEEYDYFSTFDEETGINVTVEAPMGALPLLAEVRVEPVDPEAVREAVDSVTEGEREILLAMDISFWLEDDEIEPEEPVRVRIAAPELEGRSDLTVVHIPDEEEPESIDLITDENDLKFELGTNEICFESGDFSVYAVIGGSDNAIKLTVNFYDGETLLSSQVLVKSQLAKNPLIDPGVPTLLSTQSFEGWSLTSSYDGTTTGYSVDELNTYINTTYGDMASDATLNVYAMKFDVIYITYHDQAGAVLRTDSAICPVGGSVSVLVKNAYVPFKSGQNFAGWTPDILVKGDVPTYAGGATVYQDGSSYSFSADVHLYPYIKIGAWLSFDNNLDQDNDATSASYTSPVFVETGTVTQAPATPERTGYTFGGWYEDKELHTAFSFGAALAADKTVYAKWTPKQTTYMVVFWQQKVTDDVNASDSEKTYDYYKSSSRQEIRTATTGQSVSIATADTQLGGTTSREMGYYFTYNATNSDTASTVVKGDGSTVLNVYYDRRPITINFYDGFTRSTSTASSMVNGGWYYIRYNYNYVLVQYNSSDGYLYDTSGNYYSSSGTKYYAIPSNVTTKTGLYEAAYTNWPSAGNGYRWYNLTQVSSPAVTGWSMSIPADAYKIWLATSGTTWNLVSLPFSQTNPRTLTIVGQDTDGNYTVDLGTSLMGEGSTLTMTNDLYTGYKMHHLYSNGSTYDVSSKSSLVFGHSNSSYSSTIDYRIYSGGATLYYARNKWDFVYESNGSVVKTESVYYQKSLDDLASFVPTNGPRGCYFDGWYADPGFDTPFDFSGKMPNAAVKIYAKWTLTRFRVVLDPTGGQQGVSASDITFVGNQATTFRVNYGEMVQGSSINNAKREGYTLLGWYLDKDYTIPFNFGQPITNEVATMGYNELPASQRQGSDPWNGGRTYNDADGEHDDVRGKVVIYAKWREDPKGTIGIHVVYDAMDGTFPYDGNPTTWNDPYIYADQAEAYAQPASTPNDETLHFLYWDIMKPTSATDPTLVSTGKHVYPGQTWNVLVDDAVYEDLSGDGTDSLTLDPANLRVIRQGKAAGTMDTETTTVASWDFESGSIPSGWRGIDSDGDTSNWTVPSSNTTTHGGSYALRSNSYQGTSALTPDNWIFTNSVSIPSSGSTTLSFWITAQDPSYPGDIVRVYVCTSQTIATATPVSADIPAPTEYTEQTIDLSAYAGQTVYIAFRHYNCSDLFAVVIDDVTITNTVESEPENYTVRFYGHNNELLSEQTVAAGGNATPPELPDSYVDGDDTYVAIGWDASYSNIHADTDIHAVYVLSSTQTPETSRYTVYLHAVYGRKDAGSVTHINWYSNTYDGYGNEIPDADTATTHKDTADLFPGGSIEQNPSRDNTPATFEYENSGAYGVHGFNLVYDNVEIPESVLIPEKPYDIPGYTFKGWARIPTTEDIKDFDLNEDEIYIKWVEDNAETGAGHYEARYDENTLSTTCYLVGTINGQDVFYTKEHPFKSNGTLTMTFTQPSYVFITEGDDWYVTNGWLGEQTSGASLYAAVGDLTFANNGNKLYVPAGTYTFTLTRQDNSFFLSYAEGAPASNEEVWVPVTYVAANEEKPYHDMYAVWEGSFQIYHSGVAGGAIETIPINFRGSYNLADRVTALNNQNRADEPDKFLYGGYYVKGDFTAPSVNDKGVPTADCAAYDGTNWIWTTAQTENGMSMTPKAGETYYIKEVPADKYLQPYIHYTYDKGTGEIATAWLISDIDDSMYIETGFVIVKADETAEVCSTLTVQNKVGGASVLLKPETVFRSQGVTKGYLSYLEVISHFEQTELSEGDQVLQYWVTPDGLIVTGIVQRVYGNLQNKDSIKDNVTEETVASSIGVFGAESGELPVEP